MATLLPALRQALPENNVYATVVAVAGAFALVVALNVANQLVRIPNFLHAHSLLIFLDKVGS